MGNSQTSECGSVCGLSLIYSGDLRNTSLQRCQVKRTKLKSHTVAEKPEIDEKPAIQLTKKVKSTGDISTSTTRIKRSNTYSASLKDLKEKQPINEHDFKVLQVLGYGRYGKVCVVKQDHHQEVFTMKIIYKKRLSHQSNGEPTIIEREVLEKAHHPFIPKLHCSFENDRNHFLITEYVEGVKLHKVLKHLNRLSEEITRFYSAEVLLVLDYLHNRLHMTYNDLRPQNILLDSKGHIQLLDYDFAQKLEHLSETDGHAAEPVQENASGKMVDFYGLGCFIYELLTGKKPFERDADDSEENDIGISEELEFPAFISKTARDLITRLLNPKIEERLGYNGTKEIKGHAFFSQVNWGKILQKTVYPPLNASQFQRNIDEEDEIETESETESSAQCSAQCSINFISEVEDMKVQMTTNKAISFVEHRIMVDKTPKEGWSGISKLLRD